MSKRVAVYPNERIDIPDFEGISQDYTEGSFKTLFEKYILDNKARISDGFRVEIADQANFPGQFTVWNGVAFNRDGLFINNEEDYIATRTITLLADATYYVEIKAITTESDVDARGFWDPTYDNGADPSGDLRDNGREFDDNVATRLTPDWKIVTPISTSGFESTTDPNSLNIPVAIITVTGGLIVGQTVSVAKGVLLEDAGIADTTVKLVDTRIFPSSFAATVGAEAVTVIDNDTENGILTLSIGLAAIKSAGDRVIQTDITAPEFLVEEPSVATTRDARERLYQGDEEKGYVYSQDPYSSSFRNDTLIRTQKEQIDFLSAQLREIKFGAMREDDLGKTAPTAIFASAPRYFDKAAGLLGAKSVTFTVGDGETSWGDFNVIQYGSAEEAIQAAHDALPSSGGTIHMKTKPGPYDIETTTVSISKNVIFTADGLGCAEIRGTGALPALTITAAVTVGFKNMEVTRAALSTSTAAIVCTGAGLKTFRGENSTFNGIVGSGTDTFICHFSDCTFSTPVSGSNEFCISGRYVETAFYRCNFANQAGDSAAARAFNSVDFCLSTTFTECTFSGSTTSTMAINLVAANKVKFDRCYMTSGGPAVYVGATSTAVWLDKCESGGTNGLIEATESTDVYITNCTTTITATKVGITFSGATSSRVHINGCRITQTGGASLTEGVGLLLTFVDHITVSDCAFVNVDIGISVNTVNYFSFEKCKFLSTTSLTCEAGIYASALLAYGQISNCVFYNFKTNSGATVAGIIAVAGTDVTIANNTFESMGSATISQTSGVQVSVATNVNVHGNIFNEFAASSAIYGVTMSFAGTLATDENNSVVNNKFIGFDTGNGNARGVWINGKFSGFTVADNHFVDIGTAGGTGTQACIGVIGDSGATNQKVKISNNTIENLVALTATHSSAILIQNTSAEVSISGNIIQLADDNVLGIKVHMPAVGSYVISNISIIGNVISSLDAAASPSFETGIFLEAGHASVNEGRFNISSNIVRGFTTYGIKCSGVTSGVNINATICGNSIDSGLAGPINGIQVDDLSYFSVTGNSVTLSDATLDTKYGIIIAGTRGVVSGNTVHVNGAAASYAIDVSASDQVLVNGNFVFINTSLGINAGNNSVFVVGNMVEGGAKSIIRGGVAKTEALRDNVQNSTLDPTASTDIGLNWDD
jgi:hypothetical protein